MKTLAALPIALFLALAPATAFADSWSALTDGAVVLFRHAQAPGGGDPPGMMLGDCSTQRNLDEGGRQQARRIGQAFRERNVAVGSVISSQWCRTKETAELAFPGQVREEPAFNSFFDDRSQQEKQTAAARQLIDGWRGPGVMVVVTHQVNISAITGVSPAPGEGVILSPEGRQVAGRIAP